MCREFANRYPRGSELTRSSATAIEAAGTIAGAVMTGAVGAMTGAAGLTTAEVAMGAETTREAFSTHQQSTFLLYPTELLDRGQTLRLDEAVLVASFGKYDTVSTERRTLRW